MDVAAFRSELSLVHCAVVALTDFMMFHITGRFVYARYRSPLADNAVFIPLDDRAYG